MKRLKTFENSRNGRIKSNEMEISDKATRRHEKTYPSTNESETFHFDSNENLQITDPIELRDSRKFFKRILKKIQFLSEHFQRIDDEDEVGFKIFAKGMLTCSIIHCCLTYDIDSPPYLYCFHLQ